jgi:hypothetical protein
VERHGLRLRAQPQAQRRRHVEQDEQPGADHAEGDGEGERLAIGPWLCVSRAGVLTHRVVHLRAGRGPTRRIIANAGST